MFNNRVNNNPVPAAGSANPPKGDCNAIRGFGKAIWEMLSRLGALLAEAWSSSRSLLRHLRPIKADEPNNRVATAASRALNTTTTGVSSADRETKPEKNSDRVATAVTEIFPPAGEKPVQQGNQTSSITRATAQVELLPTVSLNVAQIAHGDDGKVSAHNALPKESRKIDPTTALREAVINKNSGALQRLIDEGYDVTAKDDQGRTLLHLAALHDNAEAIHILAPLRSWGFFSRIDLDSRDINGNTPLHEAVKNEKTSAIKALLKNGANAVAKDSNWETPLHVAVRCKNKDAIDLLIHHWSYANLYPLNKINKKEETPLILATQDCLNDPAADTSIIQQLMNGMKFSRASGNRGDNKGVTPLHLVIKTGGDLVKNGNLQAEKLEEIIDLLIEGKANEPEKVLEKKSELEKSEEIIDLLINSRNSILNAQDNQGLTPLHWAIKNNHPELIKALINRDADLTIKDYHEQQSPLHFAVLQEQKETIDALLKSRNLYGFKKVDIDDRDFKGDTALHLAAEKGKVDILKALLLHKPDINAKNNSGETPLLVAIRKGNSEVVKILLNHKANISAADKHGETPFTEFIKRKEEKIIEDLLENINVNQVKDESGRTLLHQAAQLGNLKTMSLLIQNKSKLNITDNKNQTPLFVAIDNNKLEAVDLLIRHGVSVNATNQDRETPLHRAIELKNAPLIELLIQRGANPFAKTTFKKGILHLAAEKGLKEVVESAIRNSPIPLYRNFLANPNSKDSEGLTPVHIAAREGDSDFLDELCQLKSWIPLFRLNLNAEDNKGQSPLHHAAMKGNTAIIDKLINITSWLPFYYAVNPNAQDLDGKTPLHTAVQNGQSNAVSTIVKISNRAISSYNNVNLNAKDKNQETPLHIAVIKNDKEIAEILYLHKADINAKNKKGETPLHLAIGNSSVLDFLLSIRRIDLNAQNKDGETPLYMAAKKDDVAALQKLLQNGASPNIKNKEGRAPLHEAAKNGSILAVDALLAYNANINEIAGNGNTPLHEAAGKKYKNVMDRLLNQRRGMLSMRPWQRIADPGILNHNGQTAQQLYDA
ncbi:MAG: ankyrin repeat domain-containing protein [Chlamydiales bacterium]